MRTVLCPLVSAALCGACHAAEPPGQVQNPRPTPAACRQLADQIENHLRDGVLKVWFPRCVDRQRGGFHPDFREDWSRGERNDKFIVFQARMTWTAAQVAKRYSDLATEHLDYARHGLDFLERTMWDRDRGGFFWGLDEHGKISDRFGTEKHVYGIAFGIYAAAAAYDATRQPRALDLGQRAFAWLEQHAHDGAHGGYREALTREGRPILKPGAKKTDGIGTLYGCKSMNSHIHLLEAFAELYRVWPDKLLRRRLQEVFQIVRDKIAVEPGCLNLYFTADWRALPDHDSFGHDVETAFLLLEAAEAMGMAHDTRTLAVARSLVDHALEWGWDEQYGGFYDKGAAFKPAHGLEKVWWTQAEGLNALLLMHDLFGRETDRYWNAFLKQWDFIWKHQIDHRHGEWHNTVSREGHAEPGKAKGSIWKAAYHNSRALMTVTERLRHLAI